MSLGKRRVCSFHNRDCCNHEVRRTKRYNFDTAYTVIPTNTMGIWTYVFSYSYFVHNNSNNDDVESSNGYRPRTPTTVPISSIVNKKSLYFIFRVSLKFSFSFIGHLLISIIHILHIHIIHKQHMQLITLMHLSQQQQQQGQQLQPQRAQLQPQLNHKHLHLLNNE